MGIFKSCYAVTGESVEIAVFELYDEVEAINVGPTNPGMDDDLGEPFLDDTAVTPTVQGIAERVRPGTVVEVKAKAKWNSHEEQEQDGIGNAPTSLLSLTLYREDLLAKTPPLIAGGEILIRPNDRLLRIKSNTTGVVRVDFEADQRDGLHVFEVRPGETGDGTIKVMLENRRPVAR